jgi:hypothetical protein
VIPEEVIRIDVDLPDDAAQSQLNNAPVMSGRAAAARLPAVHPLAAVGVLVGNKDPATGLQEVFLLGEELVVREKREAADAGCSEIDETGGGRNRWISPAHATVVKLQIPSSKLQRNLKLQALSTHGVGLVFGYWRSIGCWMLVLGAFPSASAIGAVSPWRNEQWDVIFRCGVGDNESDWDAIEKTAFSEIIADIKNEFVSSSRHFVTREQGRFRAAIGICLDRLEQGRSIDRPKLDLDPGGGTAPHRVQDMSR